MRRSVRFGCHILLPRLIDTDATKNEALAYSFRVEGFRKMKRSFGLGFYIKDYYEGSFGVSGFIWGVEGVCFL